MLCITLSFLKIHQNNENTTTNITVFDLFRSLTCIACQLSIIKTFGVLSQFFAFTFVSVALMKLPYEIEQTQTCFPFIVNLSKLRQNFRILENQYGKKNILLRMFQRRPHSNNRRHDWRKANFYVHITNINEETLYLGSLK